MRHAIDLWRGDLLAPFRDYETNFKFNPQCDVEETEEHYLFAFDLPGVSKEDVKIELVENQLTVTGERKAEPAKENVVSHVTERFHGAFRRAFTLPMLVDSEKVEARFENGVLRITVPKAEAAKSRQIKIH